jgi:hypothetical protein
VDGSDWWSRISKDYAWPCELEKVFCINRDHGSMFDAIKLDQILSKMPEEEDEESQDQNDMISILSRAYWSKMIGTWAEWWASRPRLGNI